MGRRIVTTQLQNRMGGAEIDTYFDKVLKYIPADINGAWIAVTGLIKSAADIPTNTVLWIGFIVGLILTALWTLKQTSSRGRRPAITQTAISTVAFVVWVFALGEPFSSLEFYRPLYGSLLLIFYTLVVGLVNPPES